MSHDPTLATGDASSATALRFSPDGHCGETTASDLRDRLHACEQAELDFVKFIAATSERNISQHGQHPASLVDEVDTFPATNAAGRASSSVEDCLCLLVTVIEQLAGLRYENSCLRQRCDYLESVKGLLEMRLQLILHSDHLTADGNNDRHHTLALNFSAPRTGTGFKYRWVQPDGESHTANIIRSVSPKPSFSEADDVERRRLGGSKMDSTPLDGSFVSWPADKAYGENVGKLKGTIERVRNKLKGTPISPKPQAKRPTGRTREADSPDDRESGFVQYEINPPESPDDYGGVWLGYDDSDYGGVWLGPSEVSIPEQQPASQLSADCACGHLADESLETLAATDESISTVAHNMKSEAVLQVHEAKRPNMLGISMETLSYEKPLNSTPVGHVAVAKAMDESQMDERDEKLATPPLSPESRKKMSRTLLSSSTGQSEKHSNDVAAPSDTADAADDPYLLALQKVEMTKEFARKFDEWNKKIFPKDAEQEGIAVAPTTASSQRQTSTPRSPGAPHRRWSTKTPALQPLPADGRRRYLSARPGVSLSQSASASSFEHRGWHSGTSAHEQHQAAGGRPLPPTAFEQQPTAFSPAGGVLWTAVTVPSTKGGEEHPMHTNTTPQDERLHGTPAEQAALAKPSAPAAAFERSNKGKDKGKPSGRRFTQRVKRELEKRLLTKSRENVARSKSCERGEDRIISDDFAEKLREWSVKQGHDPDYYSSMGRARSTGSVSKEDDDDEVAGIRSSRSDHLRTGASDSSLEGATKDDDELAAHMNMKNGQHPAQNSCTSAVLSEDGEQNEDGMEDDECGADEAVGNKDLADDAEGGLAEWTSDGQMGTKKDNQERIAEVKAVASEISSRHFHPTESSAALSPKAVSDARDLPTGAVGSVQVRVCVSEGDIAVRIALNPSDAVESGADATAHAFMTRTDSGIVRRMSASDASGLVADSATFAQSGAACPSAGNSFSELDALVDTVLSSVSCAFRSESSGSHWRPIRREASTASMPVVDERADTSVTAPGNDARAVGPPSPCLLSPPHSVTTAGFATEEADLPKLCTHENTLSTDSGRQNCEDVGTNLGQSSLESNDPDIELHTTSDNPSFVSECYRVGCGALNLDGQGVLLSPLSGGALERDSGTCQSAVAVSMGVSSSPALSTVPLVSVSKAFWEAQRNEYDSSDTEDCSSEESSKEDSQSDSSAMDTMSTASEEMLLDDSSQRQLHGQGLRALCHDSGSRPWRSDAHRSRSLSLSGNCPSDAERTADLVGTSVSSLLGLAVTSSERSLASTLSDASSRGSCRDTLSDRLRALAAGYADGDETAMSKAATKRPVRATTSLCAEATEHHDEAMSAGPVSMAITPTKKSCNNTVNAVAEAIAPLSFERPPGEVDVAQSLSCPQQPPQETIGLNGDNKVSAGAVGAVTSAPVPSAVLQRTLTASGSVNRADREKAGSAAAAVHALVTQFERQKVGKLPQPHPHTLPSAWPVPARTFVSPMTRLKSAAELMTIDTKKDGIEGKREKHPVDSSSFSKRGRPFVGVVGPRASNPSPMPVSGSTGASS